MSKTESLHYQLCCEGAKWLRARKNRELSGDCGGPWKYITVEMCVNGCENPDIWATNGWSSIVVEVKTSRAGLLCVEPTTPVRQFLKYDKSDPKTIILCST